MPTNKTFSRVSHHFFFFILADATTKANKNEGVKTRDGMGKDNFIDLRIYCQGGGEEIRQRDIES